MTAIKGTSNVYGVEYVTSDQDANTVRLRNGQPTLAGLPTVVLLANGSRQRLTQANVASFNVPAVGSSFSDADGNITRFAAPSANFDGGYLSGPGDGARMYFGGVFTNMSAASLSDVFNALSSFASGGVLT